MKNNTTGQRSDKKIAIYAGSFDPITNGHVDIIQRARRVFDELHIVIAVNPSKSYLFSRDKRLELIIESLKNISGLVITHHEGLTIDYARKVGATVLVRGLRALSDFDYEFHMATINQELMPDIETFFITTGSRYFYVNSSVIKELAKYGADISTFVPEAVANSFTGDIIQKIK